MNPYRTVRAITDTASAVAFDPADWKRGEPLKVSELSKLRPGALVWAESSAFGQKIVSGPGRLLNGSDADEWRVRVGSTLARVTTEDLESWEVVENEDDSDDEPITTTLYHAVRAVWDIRF